MGRNASALHSYQIFLPRESASRQTLTSSSDPDGRYSGCRNGKNSGNQENISGETRCAFSGWIDSPTLPYRCASKYPAKPCATPACGMRKLSEADRVLWLFVSGWPTW